MSDAMMGVSAPASTVKPDCLHNVPSRVARVIQDCCAEMRMPVRVVMSHAKDRWACEVRSEAMRRVRAMPTASGEPPSFSQIGRWFGRDHTSVLEALGRRSRSAKERAL